MRQPSLASNFDKAVSNHFRRAFLEHEAITLFKIALQVLNSPIGFSDKGNCSMAEMCPSQLHCPSGWCICDGTDIHCHSGVLCPNPVFGPDCGTLDDFAGQIRANISLWSKKVKSLVDHAQIAHIAPIVPQLTIDLIGAQFLHFMSQLQLPLAVILMSLNASGP